MQFIKNLTELEKHGCSNVTVTAGRQDESMLDTVYKKYINHETTSGHLFEAQTAAAFCHKAGCHVIAVGVSDGVRVKNKETGRNYYREIDLAIEKDGTLFLIELKESSGTFLHTNLHFKSNYSNRPVEKCQLTALGIITTEMDQQLQRGESDKLPLALRDTSATKAEALVIIKDAGFLLEDEGDIRALRKRSGSAIENYFDNSDKVCAPAIFTIRGNLKMDRKTY